MRAANNRKTSWHVLGLTVLMLMGCLCVATGTALARYRKDETLPLPMDVQKAEQVYLQAGKDPGAAYSEEPGQWQWVEGRLHMDFMVTNTCDETVPNADQAFSVRLIASLEAWDGESDLDVVLSYRVDKPKTEPEETTAPVETEAAQSNTTETTVSQENEVTEESTAETTAEEADFEIYYVHGKITRIQPDTPLHAQFGDGWLITFLDSDKRELSWTLEGGQRSTTVMSLELNNPAVLDTSLLRLQVTGRMLDE